MPTGTIAYDDLDAVIGSSREATAAIVVGNDGNGVSGALVLK